MLLFLAQLMVRPSSVFLCDFAEPSQPLLPSQAIYLLTSLISLPSSGTASTATLLDTLPDFNVFSRLFDMVFLVAAGAIFISRWIGRKLRDDDGLAAQYT